MTNPEYTVESLLQAIEYHREVADRNSKTGRGVVFRRLCAEKVRMIDSILRQARELAASSPKPAPVNPTAAKLADALRTRLENHRIIAREDCHCEFCASDRSLLAEWDASQHEPEPSAGTVGPCIRCGAICEDDAAFDHHQCLPPASDREQAPSEGQMATSRGCMTCGCPLPSSHYQGCAELQTGKLLRDELWAHKEACKRKNAEIKRLSTENIELRIELKKWLASDTLPAGDKQMRRDAERYRWIRNHPTHNQHFYFSCTGLIPRDDLDSAIDWAIDWAIAATAQQKQDKP